MLSQRSFAGVMSGAGLVCLLATTAPGQAVMSVTDIDSHGTLGDANLSLDEAIRLANGDISTAVLSAQELAQVSGSPGAAYADTIEFSFMTFPGTISASADLTPLHAGLDLVDGAAGGYAFGDIKFDGHDNYRGFVMSGSDSEIYFLEILNTVGAGVVITAPAFGTATGARVRACKLSGGDHGIEVIGSPGGYSTVTGVVLEENDCNTINDLGNNSAGIRVSGGEGILNQVGVEVLRGHTFRTGTALHVLGGEDGAGGTGSFNGVEVTVTGSTLDRSSGFGGIGVRVEGGKASATSAQSNQVGITFLDSVLLGFNGGAVDVHPGGGDDHFIELNWRRSTIPSGGKFGVNINSTGSGSGTTINALFIGGAIETITGDGLQVQTPASGSAIDTAIDVELIGLDLIANTGKGLHMVGLDGNTQALSLEVRDCLVDGSTGAGLSIEPSGPGTNYEVLGQGVAFRGNGGGGVTVGAGSTTGFDVDLGGGALGSTGGNTFEGNTPCGIDNDNSVVVEARHNDWGAANGPSDCEAGNSDGIPDPTGSGDGVSERVQWSPFVAFDENPYLSITGSLNPPLPITILVDEGETGKPYLLFFSLSLFDPPVPTNLGNHFYLGVPLFYALSFVTGTPLGPFNPPGNLPPDLAIYFQAGVIGTDAELTNFATLR